VRTPAEENHAISTLLRRDRRRDVAGGVRIVVVLQKQ